MWRSGIDWLAALDRPICIWRGNAPWSTHSNPTSQMPSMSAPSMSHTKKHIKTQWQRQYKGPWAGGLLPCLGVGRAGGFDCFVLVWRGPVQVWFDCLVWWWEALCCAQPCPGLRGFCWCGWRGLCVGAFAVLGEEIIMEKWGGRRGNNYGKVPAYERMKSEWFICIFMYFYILCVFVCIFVYLFFFYESNFCYLWCVLYFNCKC